MRYETSVVINRPIDEVWAFLTDPLNIPRLRGGALGIRPTRPGQSGPPGVGSTFQIRVAILGFETRVSAVFTEWDPPHVYAVSMSGAGFRSSSTRETFEATADGTKVVTVIEYEPQPAFKLFWWIMRPWLRRRADASAQNMKRLLEASRG